MRPVAPSARWSMHACSGWSSTRTVVARCLRALGLPLLDASADLVKEYLAAWGTDELSTTVRQNNEAHGPGKHLLHAQYLHRESILLNEQVVESALGQRRSIIMEKTLHDRDHVLAQARGAVPIRGPESEH